MAILAVMMTVVSSCSKNKVEIPESNAPVFMINGTMGDDEFEMVAGDNNAYMHTSTDIVNGVNVYSGMISDGVTSVEIGIYDGFLDMPGSQPELELSDLDPAFAHVTTQPLTILSKNVFSNAQYISSIEWKLNGVSAGTNDVEIIEPGHYNVCAEITYLDQTTETLCNDLILGYSINGNFSINADVNGGYVFADLLNVTGVGVNNVIWFLDDVQVGNGNGTQLQLGSAGTKKLSAEVHFSNGVVRRKSVLVNGVDSTKNIEDFTMFEGSPANYVQQDFNVRILMTMNGEIYSSELASNNSSTLAISNVEYYGKNNANKDVYKFTAVVSAKVRTQNSLKEIPVSFTTTFGIEIP